jgi:hypothetical protein
MSEENIGKKTELASERYTIFHALFEALKKKEDKRAKE